VYRGALHGIHAVAAVRTLQAGSRRAKPEGAAGARKQGRLAVFVGCLLLLACDKRERCFLGAAEPRCEGDVLLHCPGGWLGGFSLDLQQQDCPLQGQSCRSLAREGNWTGCVTVLGRCDPETFQPFCHAQGPVRCERGEQWVTPGECGGN
jgi:hypothetical protein